MQNVLGFGDHGSPFGGNPVSCAGAVSVVERLTDAFLSDVKKKSEYVFSALKDEPGVESVTGLGLMLGVKTDRPAAEVVKRCMENGVLVLTAKDKVRLLPPLNIPMDQLERGIAALKAALAED